MAKKLLCFSLALLLLRALITPAALAAPSDGFALSQDGLDFIKQYDAFSSTPYELDGKWYVGYHTPCQAGEYPNGISESRAEALLEEALETSVSSVNAFISQHKISLEQHQFDALVSFTYSLGTSWTNTSYRFSKYLVAGIGSYDPAEVVDAMAVWCHVGSEVNPVQLSRRIDEGRLLLYKDYDGTGDFSSFYALILDANGGIIENDTACYLGGSNYNTLPAPTRANYRFDGWYLTDGTKLSETSTVQETLHVTAQWSPSGSLSFQDVQKDDWFYSYVYDLYNQGVISGHSASRFGPGEDVTLSQSLKLVLLAVGFSQKNATSSHWASGYLDFAISRDFLADGDHSLDLPVSRLEIATLAAKALSLPASTTSTPFADTADNAVLALYDIGVIEGSIENGILVFKPDSNITRAEISAIIWRMNQLGATPDSDTPKEQFEYNGRWLDVLPGVALNTYNKASFYKDSRGYILYPTTDYTIKTGVDVSVYQNNIDWEQVKAAGIDFAIIRVGGRGWGTSGNLYSDRMYKQNIEGALAAGLDVGVYFFSQAITVAEAREEAQQTLDAIKGYDINYPVVFDWELTASSDARTYGLATETLCAAANAFCSMVEDAGYKPMIYFNSYAGYVKYDLSKINNYEFWFAQYSSTPSFYYNFDMWQYTSSGSVPGIEGKVDLNLYLIPKS